MKEIVAEGFMGVGGWVRRVILVLVFKPTDLGTRQASPWVWNRYQTLNGEESRLGRGSVSEIPSAALRGRGGRDGSSDHMWCGIGVSAKPSRVKKDAAEGTGAWSFGPSDHLQFDLVRGELHLA